MAEEGEAACCSIMIRGERSQLKGGQSRGVPRQKKTQMVQPLDEEESKGPRPESFCSPPDTTASDTAAAAANDNNTPTKAICDLNKYAFKQKQKAKKDKKDSKLD